MNQTGIIILAAGNSSRLGRPKQLLRYQAKSLIAHVTGESIKANLFPIVVVTGANAEEVSLALYNQDAVIVYNETWQQGMASGIVQGLSKMLLLNNSIDSVILSVCDQPFLSAEIFDHLRTKKAEGNKGIIASSYADTTGTPVLLDQKYFESLLQLKGEEGAKKLLKMHEADVATVFFPKGNIDIDTEEDYKNLLNQPIEP